MIVMPRMPQHIPDELEIHPILPLTVFRFVRQLPLYRTLQQRPLFRLLGVFLRPQRVFRLGPPVYFVGQPERRANDNMV